MEYIFKSFKVLFLVKGKDDMNMCEISLEDTGLPQKRGAAILESDFEEEWSKHGGAAYTRSERQIPGRKK